MAVTNRGAAPATVRGVRLEGRALGLAFFAYDVSVGIEVAPGATEWRQVDLNIAGLKGQATGLLGASLELLGPQRQRLNTQSFVVDVRGSMRSVYGSFGLAVAAVTGLLFLGALYALASNRLPTNRLSRGLRFLTPGLGFGLVMVFTLSSARVFVPRPGRWAPIVIVSAAAFLALGYLTPTPTSADDHEDPTPVAGVSA
jgi:hypothetical protein